MMTAQYQAALHSYAEGQYEEAMQQFSELLYEDPRNPKLHIWLGATFRKAGKMEYAKVQYQQVLTLTDDPDLLDLASASLAQIHNKLAHTSAKSVNQISTQKEIDIFHPSSIAVLKKDVSPVVSPQASGFIEESLNHHIVTGKDRSLKVDDAATLLTVTPNDANKEDTQNGDQHNNQTNNQKSKQTSKKSKNQKDSRANATERDVNALEANSLADSRKNDELIQVFNDGQESSAIALEDILKFSSVGQKITLWSTLLATIPAVVLGITAYKVGDGLLLSRVKQNQQSEAMSIANATGSFLQKQTSDVGVIKTLLFSTELGQNNLQSVGQIFGTTNPSDITNKMVKLQNSLTIAQQRQYKQILTNRLNLYSQAYPQYASIALFSINGELISQSNSSNTLQTINANTLSKVSAGNNILIGNPIVTKDGANFYAVTAIQGSADQKVSMVLQVEIPVKALTSNLAKNQTNPDGSNFYVIDSSNRYIASSQSVPIGEDASSDFAILSNLRALPLSDLSERVKDDRSVQILSYSPVANIQSYGISWDVLTTIDKATVITANQSLLVVIGSGIAATPLLVAVIAYALSRRLSTRLKDIRAALRDLRQGKSSTSFAALSTKGNDELADISLSINRMSEQLQTIKLKQEQEKQRLQLQVVKLFKVLSKLAREDKQEYQEADLSNERILSLDKKIRGEMGQRNAEVERYRKQKVDLQDQLMQMLKDIQKLADGDLTVATTSIDGNLSDVAIFFDDVIRGLQKIVGQIKSSASQVNLSLGQNEQAIANLTSISHRQVDNVTRSLNATQMAKLSAHEIATNSQQIIQSSRLVAEKLSDSDSSIDAVMEKVSALQSTITNTAKRVKHLGESSQKIAKAISSINEIAIKTNFLAINATLEATRTGNTGIEFVMVAEEVGKLATRSVATTKEVESLLIGIQSETNAVMMAVESGSNQATESNTLAIAAKDSLLQISQISQQIDGLVLSIADATISQVQTSEGVANLMKDISHIANRNLDASSEASKFLKTTKKYSGDLQQSLANFKTR
jgi:twitching motility protein PilJ